MQATAAGGKIIAADWNGLVRVWTPDGTKVGDLDSNPPTIAQRIDANKRLADLALQQAQAQTACKQATDALAAARKTASDGDAALTAKKTALAAAQARVPPLEKQSRDTADALKKAQDDSTHLASLLAQIAPAALASPELRPTAISTFAMQTLATQSLVSQQAALAKAQTDVNSAHDQTASLSRDVATQQSANTTAATNAKSAESALATAQSAADESAAEIKSANLSLQKWRAAAARVATPPQYAAQKTDAK